MPWRRRRYSDDATLNAIRLTEADIRLLASEERILRQELNLPPVTDVGPHRWIAQALVPGSGHRTRARRGPGSLSIPPQREAR